MGELVATRTWRVQGETITLPVRFTDAEVAAAVFTARPGDAAACLAGTGLRPFTVAGRAMSVLMLVHYGEWVLGSYDEVGVGLLTRGPGGRRGLHIVELPVTGELTCEAGRDIWGLPKWLMRAELRFDGRSAAVTVHDGDAFVMRAALRAGRVGVPFGVPGADGHLEQARRGRPGGAAAARRRRDAQPRTARGARRRADRTG
jgi:hypothetical protein